MLMGAMEEGEVLTVRLDLVTVKCADPPVIGANVIRFEMSANGIVKPSCSVLFLLSTIRLLFGKVRK